MNIRDTVPPSGRSEALEMAKKLAQGDKLEPFLTERLTRSGETITVWMVATVLINGEGRPYAISTTERQAHP